MLHLLKNGIFAIALCAVVAAPASVLAVGTYNVGENDWNLVDGEGEGSLVDAFAAVIGFIASLLAVLAILVIVVAGVLYITSGGDEGRIATAKSWLTYAIVGLIVALLAYVIVQAVSTGIGAGGGGAGK